MKAVFAQVVCLWALVLLSGCGVSPIYNDAARSDAALVSGRASWKVGGDFSNPELAADGNVHTVALAPKQELGSQLTLDLGKPCLFNMVVIDHGPNIDGYCRRLAVSTSINDRDYVRRHAVAGTRRVTIISLPQPVLARYVRLEIQAPGSKPCSIAEIYFQ